MFSSIFRSVLNRHAPIKVYNQRTNYRPFLSDMTKQIMKERDSKKEAATRNSDPILLEEYRRLRNRVKK